jgi:8-oxo-dGDP phosphatase
MPAQPEMDPGDLTMELVEETGLRARHMHRLGRLHPAKGMSSQAYTVFVAEGLEAGEPAREHEEQDMRQGRFTQCQIESMIRAGNITDAATVAAYLLYLFSNRNRASHEFGC